MTLSRLTPSASIRERVTDHALRSYDDVPTSYFDLLFDVLGTAKCMAGVFGALCDANTREEVEPHDMAVAAWMLQDDLKKALILLEGLRQDSAAIQAGDDGERA